MFEYQVKKLKAEEEIIVEISAKFAYFLEQNSITPYNDAFTGHLEYLIREKTKLGETIKVEELKQMMAQYEAQKIIIKRSVKNIGRLFNFSMT